MQFINKTSVKKLDVLTHVGNCIDFLSFLHYMDWVR